MRLWQVKFEVYQAMWSFPVPGELVEEVQDDPSYHLSGKSRVGNFGGQLSCTLSGVGGFRDGEREYRLKPGMAFLAMHNDPAHSYFYPPEGTETWRFLWISFGSDVAENMVRDLNKRYGYIFHLPLDSGIIRRLSAYSSYRDMVQVLSPLAGGKLVVDVLTSLGEGVEKSLSNDPQSDLVRRAQELMLASMAENVGVADIAEELQISREHLTRVFKHQTGISPSDYLQRRKIQLASHLLRDTRLSCQEIAERLGYESLTSFSRAFKSRTKLSPRTFRKTGYLPEFETL